jgi:hypothetical protein
MFMPVAMQIPMKSAGIRMTTSNATPTAISKVLVPLSTFLTSQM